MNIINFFRSQSSSNVGHMNHNHGCNGFVPSPILYNTPIMPIDYGIPDDMLMMDDGKSDGNASAMGSPIIGSAISGSGTNNTNSSAHEHSLLNLDNWVSMEGLNCEVRYGNYETQGARKYMEDRHKIKQDINVDDSSISVFGVFDGHGGDKASIFVQKKIVSVLTKHLKKDDGSASYASIASANNSSNNSPKVLFDSPNFQKYNNHLYSQSNFQQEIQNRSDRIQKALFNSFHTLDKRFCKKYRGKKDSGTTCLVSVLSNPTGSQPILVVANSGDSRGVLCRSGKAIPLSYDHKPQNKKEKARIQSLGGKVEWDYDELIWRVQGILSVSRGIGDLALKKWVICDPEFVVIPLKGPAISKRKNLCPNSNNSTPCSIGHHIINGSPSSSVSTPLSASSKSNIYKLSPSKSSNYIKAAEKSTFSPQLTSSGEMPIKSDLNSNNNNSLKRSSTTRYPFESPNSALDTPPQSKIINQLEGNNNDIPTRTSSTNSLKETITNTNTISTPSALCPSGTCPNLNSKMYYCSQHQYNYGDVDQYFVLATDGVWDVFNNQDLIDYINKLIEELYHSKKSDWEPNEISKRVVEEASKRGSGDNSTVLIIKLYW